MKQRNFCLALVLMLLACGNPALGQGPLGPHPKRALTPADYKPQTLKQVLAEEAKGVNQRKEEDKVLVHGDLRPSRVQATYTGRARPLSRIKQTVLRRWAQLYAGNPEHYTVPYQTELLFKDGGVNYWLAVKKESLTDFKKQFKKGDAVDLFLVRLGGVMTGDTLEPLLLVESFKTPLVSESAAEQASLRNQYGSYNRSRNPRSFRTAQTLLSDTSLGSDGSRRSTSHLLKKAD